MAMALNYGCLHVCTGLRSTQHCAQSFNSPARRARRVTALARAQRPTARCYAIGRIEDCRSRRTGNALLVLPIVQGKQVNEHGTLPVNLYGKKA
jgi:hypothetical protein